MNITEKIIRKLKSAGVEKAEAYAEVITEVIEDVLKKIPTKDMLTVNLHNKRLQMVNSTKKLKQNLRTSVGRGPKIVLKRK